MGVDRDQQALMTIFSVTLPVARNATGVNIGKGLHMKYKVRGSGLTFSDKQLGSFY